MRKLFALLLFVALSCPAPSQEKARTHDITLDDYFTIDIIIEQKISPDGSHVAFTRTRWDKENDNRRTDLWVVECDGRVVRRLTFDQTGVAAPRWSADSKTIYFLGRLKREGEKEPPLDGTTQVWRATLDGEVSAVTRVSGGVEGFDLDRKAVFYQVNVEKTDGEWKSLKERFKSIDYGHDVYKISQIWKLDLESWRASKAIDEGRFIREFHVAPDGKHIAMITAPDETVIASEGRSVVRSHALATGKTETWSDRAYRADAPSPYAWLDHLAVGPDGRIAFNAVFDAYPAEIIVRNRRLSRPEWFHVRGYGSPLQWTPKGLLLLGEDRGRVRLYSADTVADRRKLLTSGDVVVESFSADEKGERIALVMNNTTHTPDLFLLFADGGMMRLTNINPQVDTWKLPQISVVEWKSKDGTRVEGILELPPDYKKGDKVPLVVCIHGGPTTADRYHLQYWIYGRTLLPAKGYAVLCPNYRGSTGYGDKFLTDLVGHENEREVADILAGVDALVERGIADPERLGVSGWSNGGYLTNCLIAHTTRFKAASSGAGILDTVMEWGSNDEPAYAMVFKKGLPWDQAELYRKTSPTYALDRVRTPTLIHVGGNDERCPPSHSRMLHRALKEYVKVPTELLVYPGEPHGLTKYSNRKAKMEWDLAWFDRYILGKSAD